ncbi:pimeloyl-ACP methyl ester carboxylesterase [Bacillus pakistanensis]|uniref:Pimeloyl-ACP methyl ester carboxylesterase n=1 Tax=Rossellomorea pakistanensis TaxID=992288 RepID=A0ABS2NC84_9BACI|nr:pimeloyl-ACP methyl ester carboxylesterase [Bacillus pakistanensis]
MLNCKKLNRRFTVGKSQEIVFYFVQEDIDEKLPPNIILLRATLPKNWEEYRDKTATIFKQKTRATVQLVPNTTHMLHWDKPEEVVQKIRRNWTCCASVVQ